MGDVTSTVMVQRFDYLPVGLFASIMGLSGLSVAWRLAADHFAAPGWIAVGIAIAAAIAFVAMAVAYLAKLVAAPDVVVAEFRHPIAGNLFGTALISLLLMPILVAPFAPAVARVLWGVGAVGMVGFGWLIINRWISDRQQVAHVTPAWIVPVVGLLDVPLAVPSLDLPPMPVVMMGLVAIGLFFAVPLFTLIFSRLLFESPLPDPLQPMLVILVAPFAVGFSAYVAVIGEVDRFAECLYGLMLFMLAVLLGRLSRLPRCCPFRVAWWAVSFPLAASATTALRFASARPGVGFDLVAAGLLGLASIVIAGLSARTLAGIARGELRTLSS